MAQNQHVSSPQAPTALTELLGAAVLSFVIMGLLAFGYLQQGYPAIETDGAPALSGLMFFTLGSGLAIAVVAFAVFLSSRANREMAEQGLET